MFGFARRKLAVRRAASKAWKALRFGGDDGPSRAADQRADEPINVRRWEAASTNRLNSAHWAKAQGRTINLDLQDRLEMLRNRCEYEMANNSDVAGMINTHSVDLIGTAGPSLQVITEDKEFGDELEAMWNDWFEMPDIAGQLSGVDLLYQLVRTLWANGEFLLQIVTDTTTATAGSKPTLRVMPIAPRRLTSKPKDAQDPLKMLGIERDKDGRRLKYFVTAAPEVAFVTNTTPQEIDAAHIIHVFQVQEAGQVRGVPWLATGLSVIADVRDYDNEVLDAARSAADTGVVLTTNHSEAPFVEVNESVAIERRTMTTAPPGWGMSQITPGQPSAQYVDYKKEKSRELGHPIGMPAMLVRLDASGHNFSSARLDGQTYAAVIAATQAWIARTTLAPLFHRLLRESKLMQGGRSTPRFKLKWNWPKRPQVDQTKEAKAATERLNNGTSTLRDECDGDWQETIEQRRREREALEAAGLPPHPLMSAAPDVVIEPDADETPPKVVKDAA